VVAELIAEQTTGALGDALATAPEHRNHWYVKLVGDPVQVPFETVIALATRTVPEIVGAFLTFATAFVA
jgi:hypothetical protein